MPGVLSVICSIPPGENALLGIQGTNVDPPRLLQSRPFLAKLMHTRELLYRSRLKQTVHGHREKKQAGVKRIDPEFDSNKLPTEVHACGSPGDVAHNNVRGIGRVGRGLLVCCDTVRGCVTQDMKGKGRKSTSRPAKGASQALISS